jgi:hypothetical protein
MIFCWLTFTQSKESFIKGNREENYKVLQQVKKLKSQRVRMAMPFEININKENRF